MRGLNRAAFLKERTIQSLEGLRSRAAGWGGEALALNSVASATPAAAASSASPFSLQFPKGPARRGGRWEETARSGAGLPLEEASLRHGAPHIPFAQVSRAGLRWFCNGRRGETGGLGGEKPRDGTPPNPQLRIWGILTIWKPLVRLSPSLLPACPPHHPMSQLFLCRDADSFDLGNKNTRDCKGFSRHSSP